VAKAAEGMAQFYFPIHNPSMHWTEVWYGEGFGPVAVRAVLTPASWVYGLGWRAYQGLYSLGIKKAAHPHRPILCVGNLTVGGTGKTPLTIYLSRVLRELGHEVVIGCSGYGSPASEKATLAPEGDLPAKRWGDEAALFRALEPTLPLIVGRGRVLAAELCHDQFPGAVLLMDDGLQHLPLAKDLSIVLDPASKNRRCLPAGPYREPWSAGRQGELRIPGEFQIAEDPFEILKAPNLEKTDAPTQANVLCAIGSPHNFLEALRQAGIEIKSTKLLPDHSALTDGNLFDELPPSAPLIVTLKDWVKLRERNDLDGRNILVARHGVSVAPPTEFVEWIRHKLNEVVSKGT
jgi:tetraacyldisaccharide 4'-kinase